MTDQEAQETAGRSPETSTPSGRSASPPVTAPDGIVVYPIDLAPCAHLALAEGSIQPGHTYGIHAHLTLEQVTYVLSGRIRVMTHDPQSSQTHEIQAAAGESVITLPGHSLQFASAGETPARVLFITSPPYPADHSDTVTLDTHRPLTEAERAGLPERQDSVPPEFRGATDQPRPGTDR
ncbi:MAG: cupin domain-containing protein [Chloroflexota bacterium]|nr:cupin domain-containing protein [Chloroflexota bacterium]